MTEISDALIRDIQAAMGALVRQQRPGLSHEVVQLDMPIGQMKTLFILWTAGKPQTMGQLAHALGNAEKTFVLPVGSNGLPAYFAPFLNPFANNVLGNVGGGEAKAGKP